MSLRDKVKKNSPTSSRVSWKKGAGKEEKAVFIMYEDHFSGNSWHPFGVCYLWVIGKIIYRTPYKIVVEAALRGSSYRQLGIPGRFVSIMSRCVVAEFPSNPELVKYLRLVSQVKGKELDPRYINDAFGAKLQPLKECRARE